MTQTDAPRNPAPSSGVPEAPPGYAILDKIGQGAMGLVARARHLESGRIVALKSILTEEGLAPDADDIRRFQREVRALILLKHRCLVEVFDVVTRPGSISMAMELLDGQDLRGNIDEAIKFEGEAPDWDRLAWVFEDLASALAYCHQQGLLHRDVKPQNVVLDNEQGRAVLIDFGLIKHVEKSAGASLGVSLTAEGSVVGTPAFMSPEQLFPGSDFGPVTAASDVWGFGATLFFCLTGQAPYGGGSMVDIAMRMKEAPPPDPRELRPATPVWVAELCAACLHRQADRRPTMEEVSEALVQHRSARPQSRFALWRALLWSAALILAALGAHFGTRPRTLVIAPRARAGSIELDSGDARRLLEDHEAWASARPELLERIALRLADASKRRLRFLGLERFERGGRAYEIARYEHRATGLRLHLIPGGPVSLRYFSDPEDDLVTALRALLQTPKDGASLGAYNSEYLRDAAEIFPEELAAVARNWRFQAPQGAERIVQRFLNGEIKRMPAARAEEVAAVHRFFKAAAKALAKKHIATMDTTVAPFLLAQGEMTEAVWSRISGEEPRTDRELPAVEIPYSRMLDALESDESGLRLASRAEWLFAFAGGSEEGGFWGDGFERMEEYTWFRASIVKAKILLKDARPRRVSEARGTENAFGLVDMLGNVSEWAVEDWSAWEQAFRSKSVTRVNVGGDGRRLALRGSESRDTRLDRRYEAIMGGNYLYSAKNLRRWPYYFQPPIRSNGDPRAPNRYGFRLALDLPELDR